MRCYAGLICPRRECGLNASLIRRSKLRTGLCADALLAVRGIHSTGMIAKLAAQTIVKAIALTSQGLCP